MKAGSLFILDGRQVEHWLIPVSAQSAGSPELQARALIGRYYPFNEHLHQLDHTLLRFGKAQYLLLVVSSRKELNEIRALHSRVTFDTWHRRCLIARKPAAARVVIYRENCCDLIVYDDDGALFFPYKKSPPTGDDAWNLLRPGCAAYPVMEYRGSGIQPLPAAGKGLFALERKRALLLPLIAAGLLAAQAAIIVFQPRPKDELPRQVRLSDMVLMQTLSQRQKPLTDEKAEVHTCEQLLILIDESFGSQVTLERLQISRGALSMTMTGNNPGLIWGLLDGLEMVKNVELTSTQPLPDGQFRMNFLCTLAGMYE